VRTSVSPFPNWFVVQKDRVVENITPRSEYIPRNHGGANNFRD
jgi:hypothetical protein